MATSKNGNNIERVTTGKPYSAGAIYVGPLNNNGQATASLPTSATTALPEGYKCLGYITDAGVTNTPTVSSEQIKAWGGDVILNPRTDYSEQYNFGLAEYSKVVLDTVWETDGSDDEGLTIKHNPTRFDEIHVFVIMKVYQDGSVGRTIIPRGKIDTLDAVSFTDNEVVSHNITIAALPGGFPDTIDSRTTSIEYKSAPNAEVAKMMAEAAEPVAVAKK